MDIRFIIQSFIHIRWEMTENLAFKVTSKRVTNIHPDIQTNTQLDPLNTPVLRTWVLKIQTSSQTFSGNKNKYTEPVEHVGLHDHYVCWGWKRRLHGSAMLPSEAKRAATVRQANTKDMIILAIYRGVLRPGPVRGAKPEKLQWRTWLCLDFL